MTQRLLHHTEKQDVGPFVGGATPHVNSTILNEKEGRVNDINLLMAVLVKQRLRHLEFRVRQDWGYFMNIMVY